MKMVKRLVIFLLASQGCASKEIKMESVKDLEESDLLIEETPSPDIPTSCIYSGINYKVGQNFAAADGCNQCVCEAGEKIVCTLKDCNAIKEKAKQKREKYKKYWSPSQKNKVY